MQVAVRHGRADLVVANDVLPKAPDLFDFVAGLVCLLRPTGIVCLQVPHLLSLLQNGQFDAFRHDTYAYLSLRVLERLLRSVGLRVFDAERLPDHGGSLRVYACHADGAHGARPGLKAARVAESLAELDQPRLYGGFSDRVAAARSEILGFLRTRSAAGRRIAGYGASTRGATVLNYCGLSPAEIACVADPDPVIHGRLMPGSHIPIVSEQALLSQPPDDVVILAWPNVAAIVASLQPLRQRGTQLWTVVPRIGRV
jgi:C-methyltransferase-like protein